MLALGNGIVSDQSQLFQRLRTVEQIYIFKLIFYTFLTLAHPQYFGCSQDQSKKTYEHQCSFHPQCKSYLAVFSPKNLLNSGKQWHWLETDVQWAAMVSYPRDKSNIQVVPLREVEVLSRQHCVFHCTGVMPCHVTAICEDIVSYISVFMVQRASGGCKPTLCWLLTAMYQKLALAST